MKKSFTFQNKSDNNFPRAFKHMGAQFVGIFQNEV